MVFFVSFGGEGWRAAVDLKKVENYPDIKAWFLKEKTKQEQDTEALLAEIEEAGDQILTLMPARLRMQYLNKKISSPVVACPICREAYPTNHGAICRGCQGENPYQTNNRLPGDSDAPPFLESVPVESAVGERTLHDMTRIVPGISKGPEFKAGQEIDHFRQAMDFLKTGPLFRITHLNPASVGIIVTGTEIYQGLIEDKFEPIIRSKVEKLNCTVVQSIVVADNADQIAEKIKTMVKMGIDLIVTTAGLSVDPDDQTRKGLMQAGLENALYGAPILPGATTLVGKIESTTVIGVPACALFHKTTSFDLLLPRILAKQEITRLDLAKMAVGGFCLSCNACTFPKCSFGK